MKKRTKLTIHHLSEGNKELLSDLYIQSICHDAKGWKEQLVRVFHILMILSGTYSPFFTLSLTPSLSPTPSEEESQKYG